MINSTIQYNKYNTIQYNTIQYKTIHYNTLQYNTIQRVYKLGSGKKPVGLIQIRLGEVCSYLICIIVWCIFTQNHFQWNFHAETIELMRKEFNEWSPFYLDQDGPKSELTRTAVVFIDKVWTSLRIIQNCCRCPRKQNTILVLLMMKRLKAVWIQNFLSLGIATRQCRRFDSYKWAFPYETILIWDVFQFVWTSSRIGCVFCDDKRLVLTIKSDPSSPFQQILK